MSAWPRHLDRPREATRPPGPLPTTGSSQCPGSVLWRHIVTQEFADDGDRPRLHLIEDAADVLAQDAEREELNAADEQNGEGDRRHPGAAWNNPHQLPGQDDEKPDEGKAGDRETGHRREA